MTDKILIDRSVVEQALWTLEDVFGKHKVDVGAINALRAALEQPQGEVVVTTNQQGHCVAVTRQDEEGRILSVVWESKQPQVEQEPVAWMNAARDMTYIYGPYHSDDIPLYDHPQNLNCKSTQHRLATLWGYVKEQPPRQPLTELQIFELTKSVLTDGTQVGPVPPIAMRVARAVERAHGIGGEQ